MDRNHNIAAADFKARCLRIMDDVARDHRAITITKHGRPVARLVPIKEEPGSPFGWLKGSVSLRETLADSAALPASD